MKQMIFVHGDKGGVGKSTLAALIVDYALHSGLATALVEGDLTIRDVAPRFENTAASIIDVDLARPDLSEDAIVALFSAVEEHLGDAEIVVINTPASSSATLDKQAEIIAPTIAEMGFSLRVAWMIDVGEDSARLANQSALCRLAARKIAVQNTRLKPVEALPWHRHPARQAWLASGGIEAVLPGLTERVIGRVRELQSPYSYMALDRDSGLTIVERQALKRWVEQSWAQAVVPILGEGESHG
jgi:NAD(P)-dependent dehydrogenase (short-subunit alcohol dehydrogenase family)